MKKVLIIAFSLLYLACNDSSNNESLNQDIAFNETKWKTKEGMDYPYRESMLNDLVYNDDFRKLKTNELIDLLGQPDYYREDSSYLYYRIDETRLAYWKLHTKTLVIKTAEDSTITWMKIHK